MNDAERNLIRQMRTTAASHRRDGEPRTADLLERSAQKIERLLARIDALMLEFCPEEMSAEQTAEWARHQRQSTEPAQR